jgi:hypothetical protein
MNANAKLKGRTKTINLITSAIKSLNYCRKISRQNKKKDKHSAFEQHLGPVRKRQRSDGDAQRPGVPVEGVGQIAFLRCEALFNGLFFG